MSENMYWIEKGLEQARQGNFNELGNLQSAAQGFDIAVAKASMLLNLLPKDIRDEIEA